MLTSIHDTYELRALVVYGCRILVNLQLDAAPFGNVSVRVPGTNEFWVNPNGVTFDQLTPSDIIRTDTDGNLLEGERTVHPGEFIHRQIYKLRPDINAVVHTHSEHTVYFSLLGVPVEPYTTAGAAFYQDQGIYDGFTGPVRTVDEGYQIASAMEDYSIVIAKNHGVFVAGKTIQAALWDMVLFDQAARVHLKAIELGLKSATLLSPEFLQKSRVEMRDKQCQAMWHSYMHKLKQTNPSLFTERQLSAQAG